MMEDNRYDVTYLRETLGEAGLEFDIEVIRDGETALAWALDRHDTADDALPHLILLDLNLPRQDGLTVLRAIRANAALADVPVVILTNSAWPEDRTAATQHGATIYLRKPFDLQGYSEIASEVLRLLAAPG